MNETGNPTNPFAPTPLGKGWTPPPRPGERPEAHAAADDATTGLEDLFEPGASGPAGTDDATATGGLDDLFEPGAAEPGTTSTTTAATTTETGGNGGLDDLFDTTDTPGGGNCGLDDLFDTTDTPGGAAAEAPPRAGRPRVRRRGVPAALRAKNRVIADADGRGADRDDTTPPGTRTPPGVPTTAATPSTPHASPSPAPVPSAAATAGDRTSGASRRSLFSHGAEEVARAWRIVDQTLAIVQADTALQQVTADAVLTTDPVEYAAQRTSIHGALRRKMAAFNISPSGVVDIETILDLVVDEISGISVLGELFRDPGVDEILVDRWDLVSVERGGQLERTPIRFRDPQHAESCARSLALKVSDRAVSRAIPLVTAELPSARVTFAFGSVVKGGLSITIRKFRPLLGLDDLLRYGSLDTDMAGFLRAAVQARAGILVSGGTGTGKTTIVNLLSSFIPDTERVISIEDAFELKLANTHVVSLQTKEASSLDDTVSVTLAELLRNTLRMRPDRIIVGEIREGAGTMVMLSAASTGHDGTLTTVHANSADGAVNERLPDLVRQGRGGLETETILRSITNAFELVVHVSRTRDGRRYLAEISALAGIDQAQGRIRLRPVFTGEETPQGVVFSRRELDPGTDLAHRMTRRKEA